MLAKASDFIVFFALMAHLSELLDEATRALKFSIESQHFTS
jgi:hypothetical protein